MDAIFAPPPPLAGLGERATVAPRGWLRERGELTEKPRPDRPQSTEHQHQKSERILTLPD